MVLAATSSTHQMKNEGPEDINRRGDEMSEVSIPGSSDGNFARCKTVVFEVRERLHMPYRIARRRPVSSPTSAHNSQYVTTKFNWLLIGLA